MRSSKSPEGSVFILLKERSDNVSCEDSSRVFKNFKNNKLNAVSFVRDVKQPDGRTVRPALLKPLMKTTIKVSKIAISETYETNNEDKNSIDSSVSK